MESKTRAVILVLLLEKQVDTMQVDFSEKEPSQKYHNVLSCIIKSNLCDAFMYEHKMHVEYKISRLFERLILKSFHFKECHHVCQSRACQIARCHTLNYADPHGKNIKGVKI